MGERGGGGGGRGGGGGGEKGLHIAPRTILSDESPVEFCSLSSNS